MEPSPQKVVLSASSGGVCTSETGTSVGCSFQLSTSSPSVSDLLRSSLRMALRVMLEEEGLVEIEVVFQIASQTFCLIQ